MTYGNPVSRGGSWVESGVPRLLLAYSATNSCPKQLMCRREVSVGGGSCHGRTVVSLLGELLSETEICLFEIFENIRWTKVWSLLQTGSKGGRSKYRLFRQRLIL